MHCTQLPGLAESMGIGVVCWEESPHKNWPGLLGKDQVLLVEIEGPVTGKNDDLGVVSNPPFINQWEKDFYVIVGIHNLSIPQLDGLREESNETLSILDDFSESSQI